MKSDLTKAFDLMDWGYLRHVLHLFDIPPGFIDLLMACVVSPTYTLMVNGGGSGFISPSRGLRQGCPLSPYLFILGMEPLILLFQNLQNKGLIYGVKLAPSAPPLSISMYADDLMIMGKVSSMEVHHILSTIRSFEAVSGQRINPEKTKLWFSAVTPTNRRQEILNIFGGSQALTDETYLGLPVHPASLKTCQGLLSKFTSKLATWKMTSLSMPGRLVLLKSVLMSLPVYQMSLQLLSRTVISKIISLLRRFFWGKIEGNFLPLCSWKNIMRHFSKGGLAVRDVRDFNYALIHKLAWKMCSEPQKPWCQIIKAKYFPRRTFWHARLYGSVSVTWKAICHVKENHSSLVVWSIGDGNTCPAVGEPWFEGWKDFNPITRLQRELKIRDLCLPTSGLWDIQKLLTTFNMSSALHILSNPQKIPTTTSQPDRLVWIPERSGTFSVKSAYKTIQLSRQQTSPAQPHPVDFFWKNISLKPKIKLFLWKLCAKALPTCSRLAARIRSIDPICQRCRVSEETDYHVFFGCNISRATWFASPLQIRSDLIEETVPAFLFRLSNSLPQSDFSYACALMWAIWEERNMWVFDKKSATPEQIMQKTKSQLGTQVGSAHSLSISSHEMGPTPSRTPPPTINNEQLYIYIDGAWNLDRGGWGCCIMKGLHLISFACGGMASSCPFHAEATALFRAILEIKEVLLQRQMEFTQINFLSDCLVLVNTVNKRDFNNAGPDWRVDRLIFDIWDQMETLHCCNLAHIAREDNEVAHGLAYNGRALVQETRGFFFPTFKPP
ncbi:hypothetical protein LUZ63_015062 [Rhynchospora breviuscula]|uniref:Reverse transcriptase domain-containing protein n=1 Tax=Rhynchospora breviuscula TaxID=2022672 RepID=A0A9Q0CBU1_9POAL|nr:hypothetical protein LUZ63_015062 [Rhynchospora breviuscula]